MAAGVGACLGITVPGQGMSALHGEREETWSFPEAPVHRVLLPGGFLPSASSQPLINSVQDVRSQVRTRFVAVSWRSRQLPKVVRFDRIEQGGARGKAAEGKRLTYRRPIR